MKRINLMLSILSVFIVSCKDEVPICEIISPLPGSEIEQGEVVTISVDAEDSDGSIAEVKFYIDGSGVGLATNFPYNFEWDTKDEEIGSHKIFAKAEDDYGNISEDEISVEVVILVELPSVETLESANITTNSATLNGNVNSDGGATITQRGFYWSATDETPDACDNVAPVSGATGLFSCSLTGLTDNTPYYYVAFATNSKGSKTGNPVTFKTKKETEFTDSRDGHNYKIVKINSQIWMAENLAYLPSVSPSSAESNSDPYYYVYGYQGSSVSAAKAIDNYKTYGVLYNWPAATNACPSGWHLPSDEEWNELKNYLGGSSIAGNKLKATRGWNNNGNGNDVVGFSALPGGSRYSDGIFNYIGYNGYWWGAAENDSLQAWGRYMDYKYSGVYQHYGYKEGGFSVRCLRD